MKLLVLIMIGTLGLLIPMFWLVGTVTGMIHYFLHRDRPEWAAVFHPQLGLTMADGGDAIDKEEKG